MRFSTKAIHAGQPPDPATGAIMTPVHLSTTFVQDAPGKNKGYVYARPGHPTRDALEKNIAALENGRFGLCFASGVAAENTVLHLLKAGDHVVAPTDLYGGTYRLLRHVWPDHGVRVTFVDTTRPERIARAMSRKTRLLWLESPSNPLLCITDLRAAAGIAHERGATVCVDNTFATPFLQRPLELGADIVLHSTTKYLGGHSDVMGGAVVTNDEPLFKRLKFLQTSTGAVPGPFDCFLVLRGTKTLAVRMREHCRNARIIADYLSEHPEVKQVRYPGLPSHPGHELAAAQMLDFGGMVAVELKGGAARNARFTAKTRIFSLAGSLGGVESLIGQPVRMSALPIPKAERRKSGLPDSLVRISVGIEDVEDLVEDLDRAIRASK